MTAKELTISLENDGVRLTLCAGKLKAEGGADSIKKWRAHIAEHKPALLDGLIPDMGGPIFCRQHAAEVFAQCPGADENQKCFCVAFLVWRESNAGKRGRK